MEGFVIKIGYIGDHAFPDFNRSNFELDFIGSSIEKLDAHNILSLYEILIIEISKENIDSVLKFIFRLFCIKKVAVLAILYDCSNTEKILLNQFGITDYIDSSYDLQKIHKTLDTMVRKLRWKK